jgi:folate-binding protein YgfZ
LISQKNAFLDKQGRVVATVDQFKINDQAVLLVIASVAEQPLRDHLKNFLLFSDAKITDADLRVYFDLDGDYSLQKEDSSQDKDYTINQSMGRLLLTRRDLPNSVNVEQFTNFRLDHNIALQGIDYHNEMLLNINDNDYVSYTKGCYLGQEIIARVHYKSRPPKKLIAVYADEMDAEVVGTMTSVITESSGRKRGLAFVSNK